MQKVIRDRKKKRIARKLFARAIRIIGSRKPPAGGFSGQLRSVALLAQEKLGDAILLTPLVGNLKQRFPGVSIHIIAFSRQTADFFRNDPSIAGVHHAKRKPVRYFREVLSKQFDLLFNTKDHPSFHFLLQSVLIPARFKVGIGSEYHTGLYDALVDVDFHAHIALKNCGLLRILGTDIPAESCRPYLPSMPVSDSVRSFAAAMRGKGFAGINISAGKANRYWTEEKWISLVRAFPGERFVVFSSPADHAAKERLEKACGTVAPSPATANLHEAGLMVAELKLLVTPDTAMVHVASCFGTPVAGLYAKAHQDQSRFSPFLVRSDMAVSVTAEVKDISVEAVVDAVRRLLRNPD
jgi:ADP-heptose:LPS heptosyltransferase